MGLSSTFFNSGVQFHPGVCISFLHFLIVSLFILDVNFLSLYLVFSSTFKWFFLTGKIEERQKKHRN